MPDALIEHVLALEDERSRCIVEQRFDRLRELLSVYKFPGDKTPIVIGSALKALEGDQSDIGVKAVVKLVEEMDKYIPVPKREVESRS